MKKLSLIFWRRLPLLFSLALLSGGQLAHAIEFRAVGTMNWSGVSLSSGKVDGVSRLGFGALAMQNIGLWDLQSGLLHTPIGSGVSGSQTWTQYLQVPVLLKISLPLISAGAGGYYGVPLSAGSSLSTLTATKGNSDLGLMAVAGLKFPWGDSLFVVADAAYQLGLKSIQDVGGVTGKTRNFMLLAGLAYQIF